MLKTNRIFCGDVLSKLKKIPDGRIDLIVSDIPYKIIAGGVTIKYSKNECSGILQKRAISDGTKCSNKWLKKDALTIPSAVKNGKMFANNDIQFSEWLPEVFRVLKQRTHCYLMVNGRNLKTLQIEAEKVGFIYQNLLIWNKGNCTPNKYYMQCCEFILMLRKGKARSINNMGEKTLLTIPNIIGTKNHPTEKPVELMKILIENSSNENDIVLDPFCGTGATVIACIELKRRFIGIDINREYCDIAATRINEQSQKEKNEKT